MRIKQFFYAIAAAGALLTAVSCSDDEKGNDDSSKVDFTLKLNMPISVTNPSLTAVEATFTEVATGEAVKATEFSASENDSYAISAKLNAGQYNITVTGDISYLNGQQTQVSVIEASREGVTVSETAVSQTIETTVSYIESNDFVIEEVFYTGTLTPDGNQYYGDQYMKITNNSDKTLYADGLVIFKSAFMTVDKYNYTPDIMAECFTVDSGLVLPGSGTDYPVAPGASIVIADTAIDHTEFNSQSFDLSGAAFEYFNELDEDDVDNPAVPNVKTLFADDFWTWHNRGFHSYAIGRLGEGVTAESFATDYAYTVDYTMVVEGYGEFPMSDDYWKVPNEWLADAVNLSIEETFAWIVTAPTVDSGWTYCGKIDGDDTRYGKSVRRKIARELDGRAIYKDTNNSTVDFTPEAKPSMMKN